MHKTTSIILLEIVLLLGAWDRSPLQAQEPAFSAPGNSSVTVRRACMWIDCGWERMAPSPGLRLLRAVWMP